MTKVKKKLNKEKKLSAYQLKRDILKWFTQNPKKRLNAKQIIKKFKLANSTDSVQDALEKLAAQGELFNIKDDKFRLDKFREKPGPSSSSKTTKSNAAAGKQYDGKVDATKSGSAFIICDELETDIFVPAKHLRGALNGDRVRVQAGEPHRTGKMNGKIVAILERAVESFIGTIRVFKKRAFVLPDGNKLQDDIVINAEDMGEAKDGDKVLVNITEWPQRHNHSPKGKVMLVFGETGTSDLAMKSILINNGFNLIFPQPVLEEAAKLPREISEQEIALRRDMRKVLTFTIDPADAKDFDDALSFQILENGEIEVGIHIADVTHYVKSGTALDKEAYLRSTSVYLVDRVLPMLPETLSNELCSLRPGEEKCTFSAIFNFDKDYKITKRWFGKTVTFSDRRFAYEEAQEVLETGEGDLVEELRTLNKIAYALRNQKFKNGAIAFDAPEVKFKLDENAVPVEVYVKERKDAHLLIEDFMLLANKEVAKYISDLGKAKEIPFIYRVHDLPNQEKVEEFSRFAKELGFDMKVDTPKQIADSYNRLAKAAKTNELLSILEPIAIRTMSKAAYTSDNIGHYGLGFDFYTHFTSPIRRYSDVLCHRLLELNIGKKYYFDKALLEEKCKHISNNERKAMVAERESIKYKQVEFMEKHVGEEFDGIISGIIERGIFVELRESKAEGLIGFDTFGDVFNISDGKLVAKGKRTGRELKMGDSIRVRVLEVNLEKRQIEMEVVE